MRVYLHGKDLAGWSVDADRRHTERFLKDLGHTITGSIFSSDIVHSVYWSQLLFKRDFLLRFKKNIFAVATNMIEPDKNLDYQKAKKLVSLWVAPSKIQLGRLKSDGVNVAYQPFYVDETVFRRLDIAKEKIAGALGIDYEAIRDKALIGSFQRDTLGSDLKTPKWQKGPELLIEILESLPKRGQWVLVLAGPRRHFVISECEKKGIPYIYAGIKPMPGVDDISKNILNHDRMSLLYNLVDCYLMTSKSEGGPKAVLEASFCKTMIFSTGVGLAPDILDSRCIYHDIDEIVASLSAFIAKQDGSMEIVAANFNNVNSVCSYEAMKNRWKEIYETYAG